ncbi:Retrieval of early ER protein Rer1 like protein [Aduncisulcus paluster]|uniref:Protein RER1 n=1 Tax=Aduncisulcus paluster TaxID=2918883 RepID=A0ABQ5KK14_9EUKA|nr:Retrieval of early ER protein Rer1 like protein [Aduncisulcus paluster]|eukprot:gnl/Carplike_NY0171/9990_a14021_179.p1 GENE.gnl/Carplike_NY0171/9990_a14021_179~~gnl/Carplike_NY0171/9990_a14021_179.p1  ORF type:complete len:237 (-),score=8.79 gnl/Carplike_NY0171/9990_a14021_179:76-726(-)
MDVADSGREHKFFPEDTTLPRLVKTYKARTDRILDKYLNISIPYKQQRWIVLGIYAFLFILRCILSSAPFHYVLVMYCLYVYTIVHLLLVLTPNKMPVDMLQDKDEEGLSVDMLRLPTRDDERDDDEYKPFIPKLPEFKFWWLLVKAHTIAFICTFFPILDIPVYWPILIIYLVVVVVSTFSSEYKKWVEYNYVPFDFLRPIVLGKSKKAFISESR